jgi:hypothetical protein
LLHSLSKEQPILLADRSNGFMDYIMNSMILQCPYPKGQLPHHSLPPYPLRPKRCPRCLARGSQEYSGEGRWGSRPFGYETL